MKRIGIVGARTYTNKRKIKEFEKKIALLEDKNSK